jgi:hypothetical protein
MRPRVRVCSTHLVDGIDSRDGQVPKNLKLVCRIFGVVLGWRYTNTPAAANSLVTLIIDGGPIGLTASNTVLRTGEGDR